MRAEEEIIALSPALIVEDDPAMQRRLEKLLAAQQGSATQITFAGSIAEAKTRLPDDTMRIALVDIGLPDGNGVELVAWLHAHHPQIPVLVVSAWGDEETVLAALRAGAIGYLLKEREDIELTLALQSIQRGGAPIDPFVAKRILELLPLASDVASIHGSPDQTGNALSDRETEILGLVARGYSNREIAELVALSRFTIEGYTKTIYRKLSVSSRTAAVFEAKARGWLN